MSSNKFLCQGRYSRAIYFNQYIIPRTTRAPSRSR